MIPSQATGIPPAGAVDAIPGRLASIDPSGASQDHADWWPLADTPDVPDRLIPSQESGISQSLGQSAPSGVLRIE